MSRRHRRFVRRVVDVGAAQVFFKVRPAFCNHLFRLANSAPPVILRQLGTKDGSLLKSEKIETAGPESGKAVPEPVLVVNMNGTLTRTDTLHEAVFDMLSSSPVRIFSLLSWLRLGKAGFKHRLAGARLIEATALPLRQEVLDLVGEARARGQRTALVTASDVRQAKLVAAHLGLFDEVHGTRAETGPNLSGEAKAAFLVDRFGPSGFDYVGDSRTDLPVWAAAREAITVNASPQLQAAAERANASARHLAPPPAGLARLAPYLRAMRPHQWSKNLLIFLPMLAAHDARMLPATVAAFCAFCLTASSVYLLNDLLDLAADRAHPRKRARPFASAAIPISHGIALVPLTLLAAAALALTAAPWRFAGALAIYYLCTLSYSLVLKRKLIIDIWMLSALYTIRVLAGAYAADVPLSFWMLAFSMFLFLSLAAVKRLGELTEYGERGHQGAIVGRGYVVDDRPVVLVIAMSAGYLAVLVLALYIDRPAVTALYGHTKALWAICPILLYWVSRMVMVAHRGEMHDDPIVWAARDRVSMLTILLIGVTTMLAGPK